MMEIPGEAAKEEEKEEKKRKPAKEKHTTKKRMAVPFFLEFKSEGTEATVSPRTSKKGKQAPTEDKERMVEEVCMNNVSEDYGNTLTKLG